MPVLEVQCFHTVAGGDGNASLLNLVLSPGRCKFMETGLGLCVFRKCSRPSVLSFLANEGVLILICIASD